MGPMGPRGLGPIKQKVIFVSPVGFQMTFRDFGNLKTYLLAQTGFQTTFWDFGRPKNIKVRISKTTPFASPAG